MTLIDRVLAKVGLRRIAAERPREVRVHFKADPETVRKYAEAINAAARHPRRSL